MRVYEVLDRLKNDNINVNIWIGDNNVAYYDGKNSIDEKYNNCHVVKCEYHNNTLDVFANMTFKHGFKLLATLDRDEILQGAYE